MAKKENESGLEDLKKQYEFIQDKYHLPAFSEINELFAIEDLQDSETDFLIRKIRIILAERISGYLRFVEIMLNPSNGPMFFFKLIKKLDNKDKEKLNEIYEILGNLGIECIKLDLDYSEENEVDFIKRVFDLFSNKLSKDIIKLINKLVNEKSCTEDSNSSYFG
jgi:hypothetical protein